MSAVERGVLGRRNISQRIRRSYLAGASNTSDSFTLCCCSLPDVCTRSSPQATYTCAYELSFWYFILDFK